MQPPSDRDRTAWIAALAALILISWQIGAKAARDALFLTTFDVTSLPAMVVASTVFALAVVPLSTRAMTRLTPARFVPAALAGSAASTLGAWAVSTISHQVAAVWLFLHVASLGAVLVSGFWSLANECFEPRSGKVHFVRIARAASLGGLLGGLGADRVAALLSVSASLPLLAVLHLTAAGLLWFVRPVGARKQGEPERPSSGLQVLRSRRYLQHLALLVVLLTTAAAVVDYAFKAEAAAAYQDADLMRFFGWFYAGIGLLTFGVQGVVVAPALKALGVGRAVAVLPGAVALGGVGALLVPGLPAAAGLRGLQAVLQSSTHRSAYELLFVPVGRSDKRSTKALIDVGFERLGDGLGAALVAGLLLLGTAATSAMMAAVVVLSVAAAFLASLLDRGYVRALESSLVAQAADLDLLDQTHDLGTRAVLLTALGGADLSRLDPERSQALFSTVVERPPSRDRPPPARSALDPLLLRAVELRSGDVQRVTGALGAPIQTELVAHVLSLLAWDAVSTRALRALRDSEQRATGQLLDALLDPDVAFAIRRRVPRALTARDGPRAVAGLLAALSDRRFEVRVQCGRALARIRDAAPDTAIDADAVRASVLAEATTERSVWASRQLLDDDDDGDQDEILRDRANRSMHHVFTLLSLVHPPKPLKIAFRGLYAADPVLRGTALEYLENVLREDIRTALWPFLEPEGAVREQGGSRAEVLERLLQSHESIQLDLQRPKRPSG